MLYCELHKSVTLFDHGSPFKAQSAVNCATPLKGANDTSRSKANIVHISVFVAPDIRCTIV